MANFNAKRGACLLAAALTAIVLVFSPAGAADSDVRWSRANIPAQGSAGGWALADGSDIQHLTLAADGTLYAYGKNLAYTLYRSSDDGRSWSQIGNVQDSITAIAALSADVIYYATASRVYRSTDGGKTFASLPANPGGAGSNNVEITCLAVASLSSNIIIAGTRDTDSGQFGGVYTLDEAAVIPAWTDTGVGSYDVYAVAVSPHFSTDRQLVAVVTDETDTFVTARFAESAWGASTGNARLYRDNSGASVAVAVSAAIAFPADYDSDVSSGDYIQFIAIDSGSGNGDVYRINGAEGGSSATDLNAASDYGLSNLDITGLAANGAATSASLLVGAADSAQTYYSSDGGSSWTRSRKEPTGGSATSVLLAPDFASSRRAYAATSGTESAFSLSPDGGRTWNQVSLIDTEISSILDLAPSPNYSQDNTLFLLTFGGEHSLWRSLDGGGRWERTFSSTLLYVDSISQAELSPQYESNQTVFLSGSSLGSPVIWQSSNGGQTFVRRPAIDRTPPSPPSP